LENVECKTGKRYQYLNASPIMHKPCTTLNTAFYQVAYAVLCLQTNVELTYGNEMEKYFKNYKI